MNEVLSTLMPFAYAWLGLVVVLVVLLAAMVATAVTGWPGGDR